MFCTRKLCFDSRKGTGLIFPNQDEAIRAFFMSLDLDMSNARTIFEVIDTTGDGELDIEEFVQGCIDLRGGARKVDISMLQRENQQLFKRLNDLETAVNKKGQRF
eukprot:TRINITY_DN7035_c0_g1_i3.p1 TRINITY_DN7035_c0_g1~~TRINITY_DN7035_c0_g1_i3.p1  ORF type:complete len:105 (+),score=22.31 TRINITY_DN7035_c0_g1_i3:49-363(+)